MQGTAEEQNGDLSGPPASNLRKFGSKASLSENNMATVGEKTATCEFKSSSKKIKSKTRTPKADRLEKNDLTPSVRSWLQDCTQSEGERERSKSCDGTGTATDSEFETVHSDGGWSMKQQRELQRKNRNKRHNAEKLHNGDELQISDTGNDTGFGAHSPPKEDWSDQQHSSENTEEDSEDSEVVISENNKTVINTNEQDVFEGKDINSFEELDIDKLTEKEMRELLKVLCETVRQLQKEKLEEKQSKSDKEHDILRRLMVVEERCKLTTKAVVKHDREIAVNQKKMNQQELRQMKANLVISGIKENKGEKCVDVVNSFFEQTMKIKKDIAINMAHRLGKYGQEKRNILVILTDAKDKGTIYEHAKHLKGVKNDDGEESYISDQLPDVQAEQKRRGREKVKFNKTLKDAQQQDLTWHRGELLLEGVPYKAKVEEPICAEILEMNSKGTTENPIVQVASRRKA